MASFDVAVPPGNADMPDYLKGYSEPIRQPKSPEANKSAGIALDTAGKGLGDFVSVAENTAKNIIDNDVRNTVEPIRNQFTQSLQDQVNGMTGSGGKTLLMQADTEPTNIPPAVAAGIDRVQGIQGYLMANGKSNKTYYDMMLKSAVTDIRSKYPGFTDYIDQRVSAITGVNPANALVSDLLQDANAAVSSKKTEADKQMDIVRGAINKGYSGADQVYSKVLDGSYPGGMPAALAWVSKQASLDANIARDKSLYDLNTTAQGYNAKNAVKLATDYTATKLNGVMNTTLSMTGMGEPKTIGNILQEAQDNPTKFSEDQYREFGTKVMMQGQRVAAELRAELDSKGYTKDIGLDERDRQVKSVLDAYKLQSDAILGGGPTGPGLAFLQKNLTEGMTDTQSYNYRKGALGKANLYFKMIHDDIGDALTGSEIVPEWLKQYGKLKEGGGKPLADMFTMKAAEAASQPGGEDKPTTIQGHANQIVNDEHLSREDRGMLLKALVDRTETLKNPNLPDSTKEKAIRYLYDPANNGFLSTFKMDATTRTVTGRPGPYGAINNMGPAAIVEPGKYAIFNQMFDKDVSDSIAKMDAKSRAYYKSSADIMGRELIGTDVKNLTHFTGHDDVKFEWHNDGKGNMAITPVWPESPVGKTAAPYAGGGANYSNALQPDYQRQVQKVLDRINSALPNLEHVYKAYGGNTEAMLLQTLQQYGMDFNGVVSGLPKAVGDAVAASRKAPEKKPESK